MTTGMQKKLWLGLCCLIGALMLLLNLLTPMLCDDYRYAFSFATGERLGSLWQIVDRCHMYCSSFAHDRLYFILPTE